MCWRIAMCLVFFFFPRVFDSIKETFLSQVSKVVHLKLTWIFLHGFALLTCIHVFSRHPNYSRGCLDTYEITATETNSMEKNKAKSKQKNSTVNILVFLIWLPLSKLKSLMKFFLKWIFLVPLYKFSISAYIVSKYNFLKKNHHSNIFKCFVKMPPFFLLLFFIAELTYGPNITSLSGF